MTSPNQDSFGVKNPPANAGDMGLIPRSERVPGVENSNLLLATTKFHGRRSYSLGGQKESDTTERTYV